MKLSFPVRALFALALIVVGVTSVGSYWSTRRLATQTEWVSHSLKVKKAIAGLLFALQDADAGQRRFLLTGSDKDLEPSLTVQQAVPERMHALDKLSSDNLIQKRSLEALRPQIDRALAGFREVTESGRRGGRKAAAAAMTDGTGERVMRSIRAELDGMAAVEELLLQQRSREARIAAKTAAWTFQLAALLALSFIVLLYLALRRHMHVRDALLAREQAARSQAEAALAEQARAQTNLLAKEAETRHLSKMTDAVVLNMGEGLYTVDEDGLATFMNPIAERLLGWTTAELQGRNMHDAIHYKHEDGTPFPADQCAGLRVLREGRAVVNQDDVFVRKDGTCFPVTYSVSRIVIDGEVRGLVVVFQDTTQRKNSEAEREALLGEAERARTAAERASRAKDSFLAMISHELRTPLSPILAWTALLEREAPDPAQLRKGLEAIQRCARAQAQLIEDLLDVSRIVSGKMRLEVRPVDLADVIGAALDVVRPAADAKLIRLRSLLDTKTPRISGDPQRLQQVVWNLLSNAIKFTPNGGEVTVTLQRSNSLAVITVADTGEGIEREFLPHVFDRFQQADTGSTRFHTGLGLGLAIVRHIVEGHGGTVSAESPGAGEGSVFAVKLPSALIQDQAEKALRCQPTKAQGASSDIVALPGLRVLVVDDDADSSEVLQTLFDTCGSDVRTAGSVANALGVIDLWRPEIVVSDVGMPGEDGYSLIAKLRARGDGAGGIPVIALTAYATAEDRLRLVSAGFTAHVCKPVEPKELLAVVSRTVERRRDADRRPSTVSPTPIG